MISLALPFPPTVNNLFANGSKGRFKTPAYKAWIEAAFWSVKQQRPAKVFGRFVLTITLTPPDHRRRDASNYIKSCEDLLVRAGVIDDDHLAKRVTAEWSDDDPVPGGAVSVLIEAYAPPALAVAA